MKYLLLIILIFKISTVFSQFDSIKNKIQLKGIQFSGQWFLTYQYIDSTEPNKSITDLNRFTLRRGYLTAKSELNEVFSVRYTQDITLDTEGDDAGNIEMRLKYMYLDMKISDFKFLKNSSISFGMVERPWAEYELKINRYRVQGDMFIERNKIINSADFGIFYSALLGGELDSEYKKNINNSHAGKFGSIAIGVYNGGGYHYVENNNNKTFESRVSIRPISEFFPGFQLTYSNAIGKSNVKTNYTDFYMNIFSSSYENKYVTLMIQKYIGSGDFAGRYYDKISHIAYLNNGYSLFTEYKINKKWSAIGRYDYFESLKKPINNNEIWIGGIAYKFLKNKVLFNFNQYKKESLKINTYDLALEIVF